MRRQLRLPRKIEKELSKFLSTVGFSQYGRFLWGLATEGDRKGDTPRGFEHSISTQILDQARHDPAVIAVGQEAMPFLRQERRNLRNAWGVSSPDLLAADHVRPSALLVTARLDPGTCANIAKVIDDLRSLGATSFIVVVTGQNKADASASFDDMTGVRLIFWQEHHNGEGQLASRLFAIFLHTIGAPIVISFRSRLGFEAMGGYGRALALFHRLFAILEPLGPDESSPLTDIYYLRLTAPYATVLALSEGDAKRLRSHSSGLVGPGIAVLTDEKLTTPDTLRAIFGDSFDDQRSETSRRVITNLLRGRQQQQLYVDISPMPKAVLDDIDITVTIIFHRERELAVPALASLFDLVQTARKGGLHIEARALLDNPDDVTRDLVTARGGFLDDIREVSFKDPALVRNAGVALARGRFLAFLDGDDLWGADWLLRGYQAAARASVSPHTVWHPEAYLLFYASDCERSSTSEVPHEDVLTKLYIQQSSQAPDFEPRDLLLESLWTANAFALREIYERFPYRPNDWSRQIGIEDWRWNLETLGHGIEHLIVPDTVHLIREKEHGSRGQLHDVKGLLPLFE